MRAKGVNDHLIPAAYVESRSSLTTSRADSSKRASSPKGIFSQKMGEMLVDFAEGLSTLHQRQAMSITLLSEAPLLVSKTKFLWYNIV